MEDSQNVFFYDKTHRQQHKHGCFELQEPALPFLVFSSREGSVLRKACTRMYVPTHTLFPILVRCDPSPHCLLFGNRSISHNCVTCRFYPGMFNPPTIMNHNGNHNHFQREMRTLYLGRFWPFWLFFVGAFYPGVCPFFAENSVPGRLTALLRHYICGGYGTI